MKMVFSFHIDGRLCYNLTIVKTYIEKQQAELTAIEVLNDMLSKQSTKPTN